MKMLMFLLFTSIFCLPFLTAKPLDVNIDAIIRQLPNPGLGRQYVFIPYDQQLPGISGRSSFGDEQLRRRRPCKRKCKPDTSCCETDSDGEYDDDWDSVGGDLHNEPTELNSGGATQSYGQGNTQTIGIVYVQNVIENGTLSGGSYSVHGTENDETHSHVNHNPKPSKDDEGYRLETDNNESEDDSKKGEQTEKDEKDETEESETDDDEDDDEDEDEDDAEDEDDDNAEEENESDKKLRKENYYFKKIVLSENKNKVSLNSRK